LPEKTKNKVLKPSGINNLENINLHKHCIFKIANDFVPNYDFNKKISKIYTNLIYYFNGFEGEYDLSKGIALTGTFGAGKTTLFEIMKEYMKVVSNPNPNLFMTTSTEDIIYQMNRQDFLYSPVLLNLKSDNIKKPINILINEFGFMYQGKTYGTQNIELLEMFIMKRYDIFQNYGKLTHVTMNFGTDDLKKIFSPRIIDRYKEMFNIIELTGKSYRK
jgi:DNA replication protein DnaC